MKCIFLAIKLRKLNSLCLFITVHPVQKKPSAIVRQLPTIFISRHFTPTGEGSPLLTSLSTGLRKIFDEKKRLNRSKCCLECGLVWPRKPLFVGGVTGSPRKVTLFGRHVDSRSTQHTQRCSQVVSAMRSLAASTAADC